VSYEDGSFFRRLLKRLTVLTPRKYRMMFQPVTSAIGAAVNLPPLNSSISSKPASMVR
jgi:hypothetical protein